MEDSKTSLAIRLAAGEIDPERVAFAAALGHPVALALVTPTKFPRGFDPHAHAKRGAELLGQVEAARWASDLAEAALTKHWRNTADARPAAAIAAIRVWIDQPCEKNRIAVRQAVDPTRSARRSTKGAAAIAAESVALAAEVAAEPQRSHKAKWRELAMWAAEMTISAKKKPNGPMPNGWWEETWSRILSRLACRLLEEPRPKEGAGG